MSRQVNHILIAGGGTAGWITAGILASVRSRHPPVWSGDDAALAQKLLKRCQQRGSQPVNELPRHRELLNQIQRHGF